ncbi:MAG: CAP domain-containing protein [Bacilli bacterium]
MRSRKQKWFIILFYVLFWGVIVRSPVSVEHMPLAHASTHTSVESGQELGWLGVRVKDVQRINDALSHRSSDGTGDSYIILDKRHTRFFELLTGTDGTIVEIRVIGPTLVRPFQSGESHAKLNKIYKFQQKIKVNKDVTFHLSEEEVQSTPLVQYKKRWIQLYFDTSTKKLIGIRALTEKQLLMQRPYRVTYYGALPSFAARTKAEQEVMEREAALDVRTISNVIRQMYKLNTLKHRSSVADVARRHSCDMKEKGYFDHRSKDGRTLGDRLNEGRVSYTLAGENIAYNYPDALSTTIGWLNSPGHRLNLLEKKYTHIGVGVCGRYYTQNFIQQRN